MNRTFGVFAMTFCIGLALSAQEDRIIPRPLPPRPPIIPMPPIQFKLPPLQRWQPVTVSQVEITAEVTGVWAETTMTFHLNNPNNAVVEGELTVPLPTGATVAGYALDIDGRMVDGVIVEKEKARAVFDEIVRQGVDPGLVEHSGGNLFKTRVYPIPANGSRTVRLRYVANVDIHKTDQGLFSYYVQPLHFGNRLDSFKLKISVAAASAPPKVVAGPMTSLEFKNWRAAYLAETELKDIELTEDLYVAIMTEPAENAISQSATDGNRYFAYHRLLDDEKGNGTALPAVTPYVLWDASLSRESSDHSKEIEFLRHYLDKRNDIKLMVFRNIPEKVQNFRSVNDLCNYLEKLDYDGGTHVEAALAAVPAGFGILLFSDGLDNLSPALKAPVKGRLCAFFSDKQQNVTVLRSLAIKTGGVCIDLRSVGVQEAMSLLASTLPAVTCVSADGKELTDAVWALEGSRLSVSGILPPAAESVTLRLKRGGREEQVDVPLPKDRSLENGSLVRTLYGQMRINDMLASAAPESDVTAAGKLYGLVTPNTSLMVLDSLEQYVRYGIRPPESLPDMCRAYDERMKDNKDADQNESFALKPNSPEHVLRIWNALVQWHMKTFPKTSSAEGGERKRTFRDVVSRTARNLFMSNDSAARDEAMVAGASVRENQVMEAPLMAREPEAMDNNGAAESADPAEPAKARTTIQAWTPDEPYLEELKKASSPYRAYLQLRGSHGDAPGFFMDCANVFIDAGQKELGLRIITNLAELEIENKQMLRVLGYKLRFLGEFAAAEHIFRKVIRLAPEEPQSYRDLALVLDDQERFQEAVDMLLTVVNNKFDSRFPEIGVIALTEINRVIARAKRKGIMIKNVDKKYIHLVDTDIRVVINWDTDMSDMDLWVTDPFKVKCYYSNRFTPTGGRNSCDFTQGYGPEEFMVRNAVKGDYVIETDYYGTHTQKILGPVTLYAEVFTDYARPDEKKQVLAFRLNDRKQVVKVGTVSHSGVNRPAAHAEPFPYQIKKGDTLESIAVKELGDKKYIEGMLKLNPTLSNDGKLPIGQIIMLPANE